MATLAARSGQAPYAPHVVALGREESLALVAQLLQEASSLLELRCPPPHDGSAWLDHEAVRRSVGVAQQALAELRCSSGAAR